MSGTRRPRQQLPPDRGLALRIALALLLAALPVVAAAAGLAWLALTIEGGWWPALIIALNIGIGALLRPQPHDWRAREPTAADEARVRAHLDRLSLLAGAKPPRSEVVKTLVPLSWTTAVRSSRAKVSVTVALLDRLGEDELEAVLAHELAHVLHRDAIVMTMLAGPPASLVNTMRTFGFDGIRQFMGFFAWGLLCLPAAVVMLAATRTLSRYRELAADRTAALLTGSPGAVAAALVALSDQFAAMRRSDLRSAAALDSFHFIPAREPRRLGRLWATHPRTKQRIARLERIEAAMHRRG